MALIRDDSGILGLEITPIAPSTNGPRDAYKLLVYNGDEIDFEMKFSYSGAQLGHHYMRELARLFRHAPRLVGMNCGFSIDDPANPEYYEPASVSVNADWVHAVLYGTTAYSRQRNSVDSETDMAEDRIYIRVHLFNAEAFVLDRSYVAPCIALPLFYCYPRASEQFGIELLTELRDASRMRTALHLESNDEIDDDRYEVP